jgi:flagellar hook-length control protein FliK
MMAVSIRQKAERTTLDHHPAADLQRPIIPPSSGGRIKPSGRDENNPTETGDGAEKDLFGEIFDGKEPEQPLGPAIAIPVEPPLPRAIEFDPQQVTPNRKSNGVDFAKTLGNGLNAGTTVEQIITQHISDPVRPSPDTLNAFQAGSKMKGIPLGILNIEMSELVLNQAISQPTSPLAGQQSTASVTTMAAALTTGFADLASDSGLSPEGAATEVSEFGISLASTSDGSHPPRPTITTVSPTQATADIRSIAMQITQNLSDADTQSTEIALDPVELGKVRLSVQSASHAMSVQIIAERPETLEILRRNAEGLRAEFEALGYSDIGFEFSQQDLPFSSTNERNETEMTQGDDVAIDAHPAPEIQRYLIKDDTLDLRL